MSKDEVVKPIILPIDQDKLLEGKVALITGGSSGIGLEIAKSFQNSGAKVIIAGTNQDKIDKAIATLNPDFSKGIIIDVKNIQELPKKIEIAKKLFSDNRIDILVNSAGIVVKHEFWDIEEEYDLIMDTNAKGAFFMSRVFGEYLINNNMKGHILNISSSSALIPAWTSYQMSKWEIRGFTLGLTDLLLPYGIIVNAIAPGPTATPMLGKTSNDSIYLQSNPSKRYVMPQEIASLAVYMASGVGDTFYVTG